MLAIGLFEEISGGSDVSWLLWVALGFFALMVVVGWLASRKHKPEAEPDSPVREHHE